MPEFFRPSGTFGIGLQSVFSVADYFQVITRTESEETKLITFQDAKDGRGYINVSDCDRRNNVGTTVIVYLNENHFTQNDLRVSDFGFKVRPREELIYQNIISEITKLKSMIPSIAVKQQKQEYIPVVIENKEKDFLNYAPPIILEYNSLFEDDLFIQSNYMDIKCEESSIRYRYFDSEKCCIFNVFLCSSHSDEKKLCSLDSLRTRFEYGNTIFYRNSFVESDYGHKYRLGEDRFYSYIDYNINLLSGKSEDILTFERRGIKESYKPQLDALISEETRIFIKHMVDYLLRENVNLNSSLILIIYQAAREIEYKYKELSMQYKDQLEKLEIGGYLDYKNKEDVTFSAYELIDKKLFFIRRYGNEDEQDYIKEMGDIIVTKQIDEDTQLLDMESRHGTSHPLNHRIEEQFIYKIDEYLYEVYISEAYQKQNDKPYERDLFFKYEQFLYVLFGNRRCIHAWPKYEKLQTYINSGISSYGRRIEKCIEMELDSQLKEQIATELLERGYIEKGREYYLDRVINSETYKRNLKYIQSECKMDEKSIEEMYQNLWSEELELLENRNFAEFSKNKGRVIMNQFREWGGLSVGREVFGRYLTE